MGQAFAGTLCDLDEVQLVLEVELGLGFIKRLGLANRTKPGRAVLDEPACHIRCVTRLREY
jgi:hypothetical protein